MANTGWFSAGSSPTTECYCEASASRSGSTVTVYVTMKSRHKYSSGNLCTGYTVSCTASSNLGGSATWTHHSSSDSWYGTTEHSSSSSFSFNDTSNTSATITFSSSTNTSSSYKFSGKTVSVSFDSYTPAEATKQLCIVYCNNTYLELFGLNALSLPTWTEQDGQDDINWLGLSNSSWDRCGRTYTYGVAYLHNQNPYYLWNTHIYYNGVGQGSVQYYPIIKIKYNANGGSSTPSQGEKGIGSKYTLASAISRTNYTFQGWATTSTATSAAYTAGQVIDYFAWNSCAAPWAYNDGWGTLTPSNSTKSNTGCTVNLYAVWKGNTYAVSYNANGGSSTPSTQSCTYPNNITISSAISRANGSATGYTITYNDNGGSGGPGTQTSGGRTITYTFDKWAQGSTSGTKYAAGATFTPTADTTMYATWISSTSNNSTLTVSSTKPKKSNAVFKGWATSSTATTPTYLAGSSYTITSNMTLYAVYDYYIDVNGMLDSVNQDNVKPMATFDIYINNVLKSQGIDDYYTAHSVGTTFELKNIKVNSGYLYLGLASDSNASLSGTIGRNVVNIRLKFKTKTIQTAIMFNDNGIWKDGTIYYKNNGSYVQPALIYKKINGVWIAPQNTETFNTQDTGNKTNLPTNYKEVY